MLTGIILAGGTKRLIKGTVAELLPIAGTSILEKQIQQMRKLCSEIIIVTNEPKIYLEYVPKSVRIITDFYTDRGPLGGLHAAFTLSKHPNIWITGSAMPFVSAELAQFLLDHKKVFGYDAVLPGLRGKPFPLHGIYQKSCLEAITPLIECCERRWEPLLKRLNWGLVDSNMLEELGFGLDFSFRIKTDNQYREALNCMKIEENLQV